MTDKCVYRVYVEGGGEYLHRPEGSDKGRGEMHISPCDQEVTES